MKKNYQKFTIKFQAFEKLSPATLSAVESNQTLLVNTLSYHIHNGTLLSTSFVNDEIIIMQNGQGARINVYNKPNNTVTYTINCKRMIGGDFTGSNGVVHIVDDVLVAPNNTITQIVNSTSDLSNLYSALSAANLTSLLNTNGSWTLFAPTNAAFNALGSENVNKVLGNITLLQQILKYHVVPSTYCASGLYNGQQLTTAEGIFFLFINPWNTSYQFYYFFLYFLILFEGSNISVTINGSTVKVNQATVVTPDIFATNGVVHQIDAVLLPPGLNLSGGTTSSTGNTGATTTPVANSGSGSTSGQNDNDASSICISVAIITMSLASFLL